jgi:hypothetical protein
MGRKRPPGARSKAPSISRREEWSSDPAAVARRTAEAVPFVECYAEAADDVLREAQRLLDASMWEPPLPRFSLVIQHAPQPTSVYLAAYGLPDGVRQTVRAHLERHEKATAWGAAEYWNPGDPA